MAGAGLRNLSGVYLADIVRGERHLGPVNPDEVLEGGDLLVFVGDVTDVLDLRSRSGLQPPSDQAEVLAQAREPEYFEAVIGRESALVGRTLKEVGGRTGYRAAAIAIHRAGATVEGKLGDVELHAGDTLVLLAGSDLRTARRAMQDFLVIAPLNHAVPVISTGARWVGLAVAVSSVLATADVVSIFEASLVAAAIVVGTSVLSFAEAKRAIDLDVVVMIAASLGIGAAVEVSGLAQEIADLATDGLGPLGVTGVVLGILVTTTVLTEIVDQQRRRGRRRTDRPDRGELGRPRSPGDGRRRGGDGIVVVPHADRLSDQRHGLRPGRLPIQRLRQGRRAGQPLRPGHDHDHGHRPGLSQTSPVRMATRAAPVGATDAGITI